MKPTEVVVLVRAVAAMCPAQKLDEYTADAWHPLFEDIRLDDARAALVNLGKRQAFIAPCDIRGEVKRIRSQRLEDNPMPQPPSELTEPQYRVWLRQNTKAIADGTLVTADDPVELNPAVQARVQQLVSGSFRQVEGGRTVEGETA